MKLTSDAIPTLCSANVNLLSVVRATFVGQDEEWAFYLLRDMTVAPESSAIPSLIVGLGNPGSKYAHTRHNIGFDVIDALAQDWQVSLSEQRKFQGEIGEGYRGKQRVRLLKPLTYMNHSGQAIRAVLDWYKLEPTSVLVVYDDMDLPLGKVRLRQSGSAGGHNGMKSAIAHLGTQAFPRLRIGIGSAKATHADKDTIAHVLGRFAPQEAEVVGAVIQLAVEMVESILQHGIDKTMSRYNNRSIDLKPLE